MLSFSCPSFHYSVNISLINLITMNGGNRKYEMRKKETNPEWRESLSSFLSLTIWCFPVMKSWWKNFSLKKGVIKGKRLLYRLSWIVYLCLTYSFSLSLLFLVHFPVHPTNYTQIVISFLEMLKFPTCIQSYIVRMDSVSWQGTQGHILCKRDVHVPFCLDLRQVTSTRNKSTNLLNPSLNLNLKSLSTRVTVSVSSYVSYVIIYIAYILHAQLEYI